MSQGAKRDVSMGKAIEQSLSRNSSKLVKPERDAFVRAQRLLEAAQAEVERHLATLGASVASVRAADEAYDQAALSLASKLAGAGYSRINPFAAFASVSPSRLSELGVNAEVQAALALVKKVVAAPVADDVKRAAEGLSRAADTLAAAEQVRHEAEVGHRAAIESRNEVSPQWQTAVTGLRNALRFVDGREGTNLYERVFGAFAVHRPKPAVKKEER